MGATAQPDGMTSWLVGGTVSAMLSAITSAVDSAAAEALRLTGSMLSATTDPGLLSTWFSATYWRVAALSALLTVPFLFAAAIHALVRSDLALLGRAAFGYLPLAALGVTIAAPLTTLLLSATDEMCSVVSNTAANDDGAALARAAKGIVALSTVTGSPMLAFFIGLLAVAATIGLWIELLIRAAAVDVIVLMLPLFFAAMVWPARRIWAIRAIETLIALILAKFAVVAVLTLGGAAFGGPSPGLSSTLVGATLIVLAVLSPWALLRLLPLHEVAAAAAGGLSQGPRGLLQGAAGSLHDGVRAAGGGSEPMSEPSGLGGEDSEDSVARTAAVGAASLGGAGVGATAANARGRGRWDSAARGARSGDAAAPRGGAHGFDAETASGLAAVAGLGSRGPDVTASDGAGAANGAGDVDGIADPGRARVGHPPGSTVFTQRADDDRPPIDNVFGQVEWEGFEIGEEGDEIMHAPRFATRESTAPGEAPPPLDGASPAEDASGSDRS